MTARHVLIVVAASFLVFGGLEVPYPEFQVAYIFLLAILGFAWCKADVRDRDIEEPGGSALIVGLAAPIGVPLYFFRSRDAKSAILSTLGAVIFLALSVALYSAGFHAATSIGV